MNKQRALELLKKRYAEIASLSNSARLSPQFQKWKRDTLVAIENVFNKNTDRLKEFKGIRYSPIYFSKTSDDERETAYRDGLKNAETLLSSMIDEINEYWHEEDNELPTSKISFEIITNLCDRFHLAVNQLRRRHDDRPTLGVADEYDVQDLFHALLTIHFDDIRTEEWTPSYAGGSSRMDFMLNDECIVIELKMTRKGLENRVASEQLIIDKERYKTHQKCKHLICFLYDPDGKIINPRGFEKDLSQSEDLRVDVYVRP
jgi:hypothetical protein